MTFGFLTSQIGHDLGEPVRAVLRSDDDLGGAELAVRGDDGASRRLPFAPFGRCWGTTWWIADAGAFDSGAWELSAENGGRVLARETVDVGAHRLWRTTLLPVALLQLERRTKIARAKEGTGWQDAGCDWQEANSHTACVIGLCDALELGGAHLDDGLRPRLVEQIRVGCRLLDLLQDEGAKAGYGDGALMHDTMKGRFALRRDALWAAWAWARAAHVLGGEPATVWRTRARRALAWWRAAPISTAGFHPMAHGVAESYAPPAQVSSTDLGYACAAWLALHRAGDTDALAEAWRTAERILARQVQRGESAGGPYGHWFGFDDRAFTTTTWTHHGGGHDQGETGVPPALPLALLLAEDPGHPSAGRLREALHAHVEGWLLPGAASSPFAIAPRCWRDGWVHFGGLWHGMNAAYGLASATADELAAVLGRPELRRIAIGNRQWIAGLNAGLTAESVAIGCEMTIPTTEPGRALPVAMMQNVGRRWVGTWMAIPGSIPNGFSRGRQFRWDVGPDAASDAPDSFSDEDWITHAGGWLMAIARHAG